MANLVGSGESHVVAGSGTPGNGAEKNRATVVKQVIGVIDIREVAVSKKTTAEAHEINVESLVVTLAESFLHGGLVTVGEPRLIDGTVCATKVEGDARRGIAFVQDSQLFHRGLVNGTVILGNRRSHT